LWLLVEGQEEANMEAVEVLVVIAQERVYL
jgi:hypothetical protein